MKFILGIVSLFFIPGVAVSFYTGIAGIAHNSGLWQPLLGGVVAGTLLFHFVIRRIAGFQTFEHELTHAIVALMLFRRISRFSVTKRNGGYVAHSGGSSIGNHLIGLAPYFLPTFTLFATLARPFVPGSWFPWYDVFIGITFAYHTLSTVQEVKRNYTKRAFRSSIGTMVLSDIGNVGYVFATLFILCMALGIHGVICFVITDGYSGVLDWGAQVWNVSSSSYTGLYQFIRLQIGG